MNLTSSLKPMIKTIFGLGIIILLIFLIKPVGKLIYPVTHTDIINEASKKYSLDPHLVMAIISKESKFDTNAVSHKGAKGLMQLRDDTAKWCIEEFKIDGDDIYDEKVNIHTGCAYLRYLLDKFDGDTKLALAAYNAGEGNVRSWIKENDFKLSPEDIPFKETKAYVKSVNFRLKIYKFLY